MYFVLEIFQDKEKVNEIKSEEPLRVQKELTKVFRNYWELKTKQRPFKSVVIDIMPWNDNVIKAQVQMAETQMVKNSMITYKYQFDMGEESKLGETTIRLH